jgi:dihydrofolate synthase/folylpolyglutamate synthase
MRFQRLEDWLDWQASLNPQEIELGLERVAAVWRRLCPGGLSSRVVTVAGTNGKGSSVAMLEAIYLQAGYRVGAYTSPHLISYNERIRLAGEAVDDQRICRAFEWVDQAREGSPLTYFEFGTLAALEIFAAETPDLLILEVGLGGRLDAVNIIDADVALITTVDLDHMAWLGQTREQIGREKAGIMRGGKPVVLAQARMPKSVSEHAHALGAMVYQAGVDFSYEKSQGGFNWRTDSLSWSRLPAPRLSGSSQLDNASAVLMVCRLLAQTLPITQAAAEQALRAVHLSGRLQWIASEPPVLLDVAHNPQAVSVVRDYLTGLAISGRVHAVFGLLADKDVSAIADIIGARIDHWHLVGTEGGRGQSAEALCCGLQAAGVPGTLSCHHSVASALDQARSEAEKSDLILIFGSFIVVGEALRCLQEPSAGELV